MPFTVKSPFHNWPMTAFLYPCPAALSAAPCVPSGSALDVRVPSFFHRSFFKSSNCVYSSLGLLHTVSSKKLPPPSPGLSPIGSPLGHVANAATHTHTNIFGQKPTEGKPKHNRLIDPGKWRPFLGPKNTRHVICTICWYDVADGELCLPHTCGHPWTTRQLFIQLISVLTIALGNKRKNTSNQQKVSPFNQKEDYDQFCEF